MDFTRLYIHVSNHQYDAQLWIKIFSPSEIAQWYDDIGDCNLYIYTCT